MRAVTGLDLVLASSLCFSGVTVAGWTLDLAVLLPLALSLGLYGTGVAALWRAAGAGRGARPMQVACFAAGWLLMAAALVTPLHDLSRRLFWAHMVEHEMIMALAAPLLVLARPLGPMLWALPAGWRGPVGRLPRTPGFRPVWRFLTRPVVATVLHGLAIWIWHVPPFFAAALATEWLHWAQHLSFLATALLFWWSILEDRGREHGRGAAVLLLFVTSVHTSILGVLLVFSPRVWIPAQVLAAPDWGLRPLEDQQLAGLVMWVPGGIVYVVAALALAGAWIAASGRARPAWRVDVPTG